MSSLQAREILLERYIQEHFASHELNEVIGNLVKKPFIRDNVSDVIFKTAKRTLSSLDDDVPCERMKESECAGGGDGGAAARSLKTFQGLLEIDGLSSKVLECLKSKELSHLQGTCKLGHSCVFGYAVRTKVFLWSTMQGWEEQKRASVRKILVDTYSRLSTNALPASLTQLTFGWRFNQPLSENVLPKNLRKFDRPDK